MSEKQRKNRLNKICDQGLHPQWVLGAEYRWLRRSLAGGGPTGRGLEVCGLHPPHPPPLHPCWARVRMKGGLRGGKGGRKLQKRLHRGGSALPHAPRGAGKTWGSQTGGVVGMGGPCSGLRSRDPPPRTAPWLCAHMGVALGPRAPRAPPCREEGGTAGRRAAAPPRPHKGAAAPRPTAAPQR